MRIERTVEQDNLDRTHKVTMTATSQFVYIITDEAMVAGGETVERQADERLMRQIRRDTLRHLGVGEAIEAATAKLGDRLEAIFAATVPREHRDGTTKLAHDVLAAFAREVGALSE